MTRLNFKPFEPVSSENSGEITWERSCYLLTFYESKQKFQMSTNKSHQTPPLHVGFVSFFSGLREQFHLNPLQIYLGAAGG